MAWNGPTEAPISARIAALAPSLRPSARTVAEFIAADMDAAVEATAQELAALVGVGRATVIRTAQALGYEGYPQMRVALARELAIHPAQPSASAGVGTALAGVRTSVAAFVRGGDWLTAALTEADVEEFVSLLDQATRVVVVASGLSAPLGLDAAMRLSAAGRAAEYLPDPLAQQIAARSLDADSVCLVISGSGSTADGIAAARAAQQAGAHVLVVTSFAAAPLCDFAEVALVIPPAPGSFRDELMHQSRAGLMLVFESIMRVFITRRGERGVAAREAALDLIEQRLSD